MISLAHELFMSEYYTLTLTIGSRGEVVVNYLIFAGILYSKQIKLPTLLAIEPEPKS